jgi:hypothetical protein
MPFVPQLSRRQGITVVAERGVEHEATFKQHGLILAEGLKLVLIRPDLVPR